MKLLIAVAVLLSLSACANPQDQAAFESLAYQLGNRGRGSAVIQGCPTRYFTTTVNGVMRNCNQDILCNVTCY